MGINEPSYLSMFKSLIDPEEIKNFNNMFEIESQLHEGDDMIPLVLGLREGEQELRKMHGKYQKS